MARKRTKKPAKYIIQHGKLQHQTSARRFAVWLRAGLLVAINSHLARVSESARTRWENGELFLLPAEPPSPSIRTNAQIVDQQYIYADNGRVRISREDGIKILHWRWTLPAELAELLISDFLSRKREWDMTRQYGWL